MSSNSLSVMSAPWARFKLPEPGGKQSMSPLPNSLSAPAMPMIERESIRDSHRNAMRKGISARVLAESVLLLAGRVAMMR